jgi:hypothetical protein
MKTELCLDLSSCDVASNYYVNVIFNSFSPEIIKLTLEVDRGVDFDVLTHLLPSKFPNLEHLIIDQNYSTSSVADFLEFLTVIKLKTFTLTDYQSKFLKGLVVDEISSLVKDKLTINAYNEDDEDV